MNGNKEIKIFKELSYNELPDYRCKPTDETTNKQSPVKPRKTSPAHTPPSNSTRQNSNSGVGTSNSGVGTSNSGVGTLGSGGIRVLNMCNTNEVTERTNAQTIQEGLDRTVATITRSLSFSSDVFEERASEFLPYINHRYHENLFAIPSGLKKAGTPTCFYNNKSKSRITPVSHLPCILRDCSNATKSASQTSGRKSKRIDKTSQSLCGGTPNQIPVPALDSRDYEDEIILSCLSPSTVELIVSRLTHGLQQDRLRKKFQISVKPCADPDPIRIY